MVAVTTDQWLALGAILSGIGSILTGWVALRLAGREKPRRDGG